MSTRFYDTDLTDAAWAFVAPVLPAARPGRRAGLAINPAREREVKMPEFSRTEGKTAGVQYRKCPASAHVDRREPCRRPSGSLPASAFRFR